MPALMPSVIRMWPRMRFETRWVWPTIIASTVRVLQRVGDAEDRAVPRRRPASLPIGLAPDAVPWWMTTIWTLTPSCFEPLGLGLDPRGLGEEVEARGRARGDELGRRLELRADDADLDAVDGEHLRRLEPVRQLARRLLDDVRREEREVGPLDVLEQALDAVVELVVAVATSRRGPTAFSTSIAGMSSSRPEFGGEAPTLSPAARSRPGLGRAPNSSSNIVARNDAPPTVDEMPSHDKRRRVELAVEVVQPDDRDRLVAVAAA